MHDIHTTDTVVVSSNRFTTQRSFNSTSSTNYSGPLGLHKKTPPTKTDTNELWEENTTNAQPIIEQ